MQIWWSVLSQVWWILCFFVWWFCGLCAPNPVLSEFPSSVVSALSNRMVFVLLSLRDPYGLTSGVFEFWSSVVPALPVLGVITSLEDTTPKYGFLPPKTAFLHSQECGFCVPYPGGSKSDGPSSPCLGVKAFYNSDSNLVCLGHTHLSWGGNYHCVP